MQQRWKTWLRLGVSAALITVLLTQVDLAAVLSIIGRTNPLAVVLSICAGIAAAIFAGLAWKHLLDAQGVRLPTRDVLLMQVVGLFFAAFTPGGLGGDIARTVRVHQQTRRTVEGGAAVIASRVLSVVALAVVAAAAALWRPSSSLRNVVIVTGAASLVAILAIIVLETPVMAILARLPGARWADIARDGARALYTFRAEPGHLLMAFLLLAAYQVAGVLPVYLLAWGMQTPISLSDAVSLGLIARLTAFLPISISGIGVQEGAFVVLFGSVGLSPSEALAISLMDHLVLTVVPLIGGALYALGLDVRWSSRGAGAALLSGEPGAEAKP